MSFERDELPHISARDDIEEEEETVIKTAETTHAYNIEQKENNDFKELEYQKSQDDKKAEILKLNNKVGEKYMNLHGQERLNPGIKDRLGKNAQYYHDVWSGVKNNTLFDGDIDKQYKLLSLLVSQESEVTKANILIQQLKGLEN